MEFFRHAAAVCAKDLRIELRSREIVYTMVFFAAMVVLIFSFAFIGDGNPRALVPGMLWVAVLLSGTLGLSRAFDRERDQDTLRGLLLSPAPRGAIFAGKAVAMVALMAAVEAVAAPLCWFLFDAPLFAHPIYMVLVLVLGTVGFATVGSVFAAMLLRVRARDVLLPVVLYPIIVPLLIAATKATAALAAPVPDLADAVFWIKFLAVFDAAFLVAAMWTFESLVIE
ncbi:MAG TPA: heme exporter protein CcmB [Kofleriaceae bacterium]|nr:heme exporter protein CcmB [Kofleriaceae bacterium]